MNVEVVKQSLVEQYPGVNIKENADENGVITETVGELGQSVMLLLLWQTNQPNIGTI